MKKPISQTQKTLNIWAIVLILWSGYRTYFKTELPVWFDEFIAKPAIFLIPLHYFITHIEKKNFFESIDLTHKHIKSDFLIGLGAGLLFLVSGLLAYFIRHQSLPSGVDVLSSSMFLYILFVAFASSITEEILSRGFVLKRLYAESNNALSSVFLASFLFFFLHIPILFSDPNIRGAMLLQVMATDILLSFAVSFIYLQRKNIIIPILIHAFYNLSIYLFLR
ncbi:hypothetical protein BH09PAT2_BH09PAT2_03750 [soil metagenome]